MNLKNAQTTIIGVKFDERFKSMIRTSLSCKEKPENGKNLSKKKRNFQKSRKNIGRFKSIARKFP